jgi:plastocyanin
LPAGPDVEGSTIVFVHDYAFHPATVRVRRGGRVTWVNCENTAGLSHTTTSEAGWSSGLIAPGAVFTTTLDVAGDFSYHCEPHPFMTGVVVVE